MTSKELIYRDCKPYFNKIALNRKLLVKKISTILISAFSALFLISMCYLALKVDAYNNHTKMILERR